MLAVRGPPRRPLATAAAAKRYEMPELRPTLAATPAALAAGGDGEWSLSGSESPPSATQSVPA